MLEISPPHPEKMEEQRGVPTCAGKQEKIITEVGTRKPERGRRDMKREEKTTHFAA